MIIVFAVPGASNELCQMCANILIINTPLMMYFFGGRTVKKFHVLLHF